MSRADLAMLISEEAHAHANTACKKGQDGHVEPGRPCGLVGFLKKLSCVTSFPCRDCHYTSCLFMSFHVKTISFSSCDKVRSRGWMQLRNGNADSMRRQGLGDGCICAPAMQSQLPRNLSQTSLVEVRHLIKRMAACLCHCGLTAASCGLPEPVGHAQLRMRD